MICNLFLFIDSLLIVALLTQLHYAFCGQDCLSCTNVSSPSSCHYTLTCTDNEVIIIQGCTILPRECSDIADVKTGVYDIYPDGVLPAVPVYCFGYETRKWTVIQRRINGCTDFYRGWEAYKEGFGNSSGEYWLGNENIHKISSHGRHALRIELSDFDNQVRYAEYEMFSIGDERDGYQLAVNGYSGDAGDSLLAHNGMKFSTFDRDNDISSVKNCAEFHGGAWWYKWCYASNLNGKYLPGRIDYSVGGDKSVVWHSWHGDDYGLKSTNIMMRKY